jgi:hypothetical protein
LIRDVPSGAIDTLLALLWASGPIRVASPRRRDHPACVTHQRCYEQVTRDWSPSGWLLLVEEGRDPMA